MSKEYQRKELEREALETDQLYFEGCVPNPDFLLAKQVRMLFGPLRRVPGDVHHNTLASDLDTFNDVLRMLDRRLQDAKFRESSARTAKDWWSWGNLPGVEEEWEIAKAEVAEIRGLIAAAKAGLGTRLSRGG